MPQAEQQGGGVMLGDGGGSMVGAEAEAFDRVSCLALGAAATGRLETLWLLLRLSMDEQAYMASIKVSVSVWWGCVCGGGGEEGGRAGPCLCIHQGVCGCGC